MYSTRATAVALAALVLSHSITAEELASCHAHKWERVALDTRSGLAGARVSIAALTAVWQHSTRRHGELLLLLAIADYADDDGRNAWPSLKTLAKKTRQTERAVRFQLDKLVAAGEVEIDRGARVTEAGAVVDVFNLRLKFFQSAVGTKREEFGKKRIGKVKKSASASIFSDPSFDPSVDPSPAYAGRLTPERLVCLYNEHRGSPKCSVLSERRSEAARKRIKEQPDEAVWTAFAKALADAPFFNGKIAGRDGSTFVADFDYFVRAGVWTRFVEGTLIRTAAVATTANAVRKQTRDVNVAHVAEGGLYIPDGVL